MAVAVPNPSGKSRNPAPSNSPPAPQGIDPLRDYEGFVHSLRNFHSWLEGIVSGASDVDLLIERRGHFLVAELKPWTQGVTLPYGQHLAIQSLARLEQFEVYLVGEQGHSPTENTSPRVEPGLIHFCRIDSSQQPVIHRQGHLQAWYEPRLFRRGQIQDFQEVVRQWWEKASS